MQNRMNRNLLAQSIGLEDVENPQLDPSITLPELQDKADDPLFVQPSELGMQEFSELQTQGPSPLPKPALRNEITSMPDAASLNQSSQSSYSQTNTAPYKYPEYNMNYDVDGRNKLLQEFRALRDRDEAQLKDVQQRDTYRDLAGVLGNTLATALNAKAQMNVKAPNVNVKTDYGVTEAANLFNEAPEFQSETLRRRQELLDQYKQFGIDENARLRRNVDLAKLDAYKSQIAKMGQTNSASNQFKENYEKYRDNKFKYDQVKNLQEGFNKDALVKKAEERIASARTLRELVTTNNPLTAEAAKTFAARAAGEVGALSNQDRQAFGGSKAIEDRIKQTTKQLLDGTLTEENKQFMLELTDKFDKAGRRDLNERLNVFSKQANKRIGVSDSEAKEIIRPDLALAPQEQESSPSTIIRVDPKSRRKVEYDAATKKPLRFLD